MIDKTWKQMIDTWLFAPPGGLLRARSLLMFIVAIPTAAMWVFETPVSDVQAATFTSLVIFYFTKRLVEDAVNGKKDSPTGDT